MIKAVFNSKRGKKIKEELILLLGILKAIIIKPAIGRI